jgi:HEAT repeat protein
MFAADPNNPVRAVALGVLGRSGAVDVPTLVAATRAGLPLPLRITAAAVLARTHAGDAVPTLELLTSASEDRNIRYSALNLLAQADTARAAAAATRYLDDPDPLFAQAAVSVLGRVGGTAGRVALQSRLVSEKRVHVRAAISRVLHPQ